MKRENLKSKVFIILVLVIFTGIPVLLTGCGGNTSREGNGENASADTATSEQKIVSEKVTYMAGKDTLIGYIYFDENSNEKKPGVIVVHEWWGNNSYPQKRAEMLAELGYTAFAIDMFGKGKVVDNPQQAQESAGVIYASPDLLKARMMAAYQTLNNNNHVQKDRIAAIGYCFGGAVSLNAAVMGVPLDAVVSFHGGLSGFKASPEINDTKVLVCNGAADQFVTKADIDNFKKEMNRVNASFEFKEYDGATHAFTNPEATENGKEFNMPIAYNEAADNASWQDMKDFLAQSFPAR